MCLVAAPSQAKLRNLSVVAAIAAVVAAVSFLSPLVATHVAADAFSMSNSPFFAWLLPIAHVEQESDPSLLSEIVIAVCIAVFPTDGGFPATVVPHLLTLLGAI